MFHSCILFNSAFNKSGNELCTFHLIMIAKPQSVGVNQVLEKIYDPRSVCPFVVRPKILNFLIWIGSPTSMSTTVSLKKDCMIAIIPFFVPQSLERWSGQILFSSNAVRKNELGWWGQYYCGKPVTTKLFSGTNTPMYWKSMRLNLLGAKLTKWPNTLKQFVGSLPTNCLSVFGHFVGLALKGLSLS